MKQWAEVSFFCGAIIGLLLCLKDGSTFGIVIMGVASATSATSLFRNCGIPLELNRETKIVGGMLTMFAGLLLLGSAVLGVFIGTQNDDTLTTLTALAFAPIGSLIVRFGYRTVDRTL